MCRTIKFTFLFCDCYTYTRRGFCSEHLAIADDPRNNVEKSDPCAVNRRDTDEEVNMADQCPDCERDQEMREGWRRQWAEEDRQELEEKDRRAIREISGNAKHDRSRR